MLFAIAHNMVFCCVFTLFTILPLVIILILFGGKKLPELARGLGKGIKEFKKASNEVTEEINKINDDKDNT